MTSPADEERERERYNRRVEDVHWSVLSERIGYLERDIEKVGSDLKKDIEKVAVELENRYLLIIRFVPIERGFYWLVGLIIGAVILGVLSLVLRK